MKDEVLKTVKFSGVYLIMITLSLMSLIAIPYGGAWAFKLPYTLVFIYYWAIYRSTLIPPYLAFGLGLLIDILGHYPIGLNALVFVVANLVVKDQKRFLYDQNFVIILAGFCLVALFFFILQWFAYSVMNSYVAPVSETILSFILTILMFPVVYFILHLYHRVLPKDAQGKKFKV